MNRGFMWALRIFISVLFAGASAHATAVCSDVFRPREAAEVPSTTGLVKVAEAHLTPHEAAFLEASLTSAEVLGRSPHAPAYLSVDASMFLSELATLKRWAVQENQKALLFELDQVLSNQKMTAMEFRSLSSRLATRNEIVGSPSWPTAFPFFQRLPMTRPLTIEDINWLNAFGILPLGLIPPGRLAWTDGEISDRSRFYRHDEGHAELSLDGASSLRLGQLTLAEKELLMLDRLKLFLDFKKWSSGKKNLVRTKVLEALWFDFQHERGWLMLKAPLIAHLKDFWRRGRMPEYQLEGFRNNLVDVRRLGESFTPTERSRLRQMKLQKLEEYSAEFYEFIVGNN